LHVVAGHVTLDLVVADRIHHNISMDVRLLARMTRKAMQERRPEGARNRVRVPRPRGTG